MLRVTGAASFVGSEFSFLVLTTILISVSLSNNFNWPSASVRFFGLVCFGLVFLLGLSQTRHIILNRPIRISERHFQKYIYT